MTWSLGGGEMFAEIRHEELAEILIPAQVLWAEVHSVAFLGFGSVEDYSDDCAISKRIFLEQETQLLGNTCARGRYILFEIPEYGSDANIKTASDINPFIEFLTMLAPNGDLWFSGPDNTQEALKTTDVYPNSHLEAFQILPLEKMGRKFPD